MKGRLLLCTALAAVTMTATGCDPITRHKVMTTIFDGVPSLPPAEEICGDYYTRRSAEELRKAAGMSVESTSAAARGSVHPPYEEKLCDGCHDKSKPEGFVKPKKELCFVCHPGFIKGSFVHGPAAVSDCLACHDPHNSPNPSLLKLSPNDLCAKCHRERRVAAGMHDKLSAQKMKCIDCHDPHYGNVNFFLK